MNLREVKAKWWRRNAERLSVQRKVTSIKLKLETLQAYSAGTIPKCFCCGADLLEFLTLEHPGGRRQKGEPRDGGLPTYRWLKLRGYPGNYKVACFNCNMAISFDGQCPHHHQPRPRKAKHIAKVRRIVLEHYGGSAPKCSCCGLSIYSMLSLDHINGGGRKQHAEVGCIYDWVIRNSFPSGFRVLCNNCNNAIGTYGYCPHQSPERLVQDLARLEEALAKTPTVTCFARGTASASAKLNPRKVRQIRCSFAHEQSKKALAREFAVSATTIRDIISGGSWSHV